jgi:hypothetical protein
MGVCSDTAHPAALKRSTIPDQRRPATRNGPRQPLLLPVEEQSDYDDSRDVSGIPMPFHALFHPPSR